MSTLLKVTEVTKIYKNQPRPGLDHVSFEVEKGEFLGIMGASGSGKTTLLNVLSTIDLPTSGDISMENVIIQKLNQTKAADFRKNNLGFIFQEYFLLDSLTVQENIAVPLTLLHTPANVIDEKVKDLAELFGIALDMLRGENSVWKTIGFSPIALLTMLTVVLGTIFFIYSFLPFACQWIKRRKPMLYRENTIIVVPKFIHRIRSNAKSLILLILLSAGTLAVFGATTLSVWYPYQSLERIIPSAIEYRISNEQQREAALQALNSTLGENNYQYHETTILKTTASADSLPVEYSISEDKGRIPGFECISQNDYQALLEAQGKKNELPQLADTECILLKYHPDPEQADLNAAYHLDIGNGETADVTVIQTSIENSIGFANNVGTLVLSDNLYQQMLGKDLEKILVASVNGPKMRSDNSAYEALHAVMPDNIYLASASQRGTELITASSSTYLLICFAAVIFLIATGSILYFQNISAVTYDQSDYEIMQRMGYSPAMIKKVVRRQVQIYYLIPYVMGLLHSVFAIICYKSALMDDLLGKSSAVILPVFLAIVIFSVIYLIYYQVTKRSCYKIALA